jgi:hypothetical protein
MTQDIFCFASKVSFYDFVKSICVDDMFSNEQLVFSQTKWLTAKDGTIRTRILYFESLDKDISDLLQKDIQLPKSKCIRR